MNMEVQKVAGFIAELRCCPHLTRHLHQQSDNHHATVSYSFRPESVKQCVDAKVVRM
jgi:hypothetical protein